MAAILDSTYDKARELSFDHPAVFAYVEQPSGASRSPVLVYIGGVIQVAIYNALFAHWHKPVEVLTVPSPTWKKKVLGRGDYRKPKRDDDFEYQALIWCRENDVEVEDDNEADAVCVAEHARLAVSFV